MINTNDIQSIKLDDSMVASLHKALLADGWKMPGIRRRSYSDSDAKSTGVSKNSTNYKGKENPLDQDGKPLRCHKCDSEYHLYATYL